MSYTKEQLEFLREQRALRKKWRIVTREFEEEFGVPKSEDALRKAFKKYELMYELDTDEFEIRELRSLRSARRTGSKNARENRVILDYLEDREELLDAIEGYIEELGEIKVHKPAVKLSAPSKGKHRMVIEAMISDVHYGKLTDEFNLEVCRERMREFTSVLIEEIRKESEQYTIEKVVIACLGDMIESATMHGLESAKGCEFGNSRQVVEAINSMWHDVLMPVGQLGIPVECVGVAGNHDRTEAKRTYNNVGEENLTYVIYNSLQMLCEQAGMTHVEWYIPKNSYYLSNIFSDTVLYEHYDNAKANTEVALKALLNRRQEQLGIIVNYMRGGHFHSPVTWGRGHIITNGSVPGPDGYSDTLGFNSHASQTINYYIDTDERPTTFYKNFVVYLR